MTAFDARVAVGHAGIQLNRQTEDELAEEAELVLGLLGSIPVGPNQAAPFPLGVIRVPLNKESVDALAEQFTEAGKHMKEPSKVEIANSLDGVDKAAQFADSLRG